MYVSSEIAKRKMEDMNQSMKDSFWSADQMEANSELRSRIYSAKALLLFFRVNPLIVGLLAITDYMIPDWPFARSESKYVCAFYVILFLITLAGSYLIVYVHVFLYFYYCLHINIQMFLLEKYFDDIEECLELIGNQRDVSPPTLHDLLLIGINQHLKIMR